MANDSIKADVQANFGAYAQHYVTSVGHAKGDDLAQLIAMTEAKPDWRVLDVATGAQVRDLAGIVYAVDGQYSITTLAYAPIQSVPVGLYPCTWWGITCTGDHVTGIDLRGKQMSGSIPSQIAQLTELKTLDIGFNFLKHGLPAAIGSLSKLESLKADYGFSENWTMPPELGNLNNLQTLTLSSAYVEGPIPPQLGNLSALQTLDLSANGAMTGSIPATLGNLSSLETLDLSYNALLSGAISITSETLLSGCGEWKTMDARNAYLSKTTLSSTSCPRP